MILTFCVVTMHTTSGHENAKQSFMLPNGKSLAMDRIAHGLCFHMTKALLVDTRIIERVSKKTGEIGHFRIVLCLFFKASPRAKPFI